MFWLRDLCSLEVFMFCLDASPNYLVISPSFCFFRSPLKYSLLFLLLLCKFKFKLLCPPSFGFSVCSFLPTLMSYHVVLWKQLVSLFECRLRCHPPNHSIWIWNRPWGLVGQDTVSGGLVISEWILRTFRSNERICAIKSRGMRAFTEELVNIFIGLESNLSASLQITLSLSPLT